jgi:hypothetical protein
MDNMQDQDKPDLMDLFGLFADDPIDVGAGWDDEPDVKDDKLDETQVECKQVGSVPFKVPAWWKDIDAVQYRNEIQGQWDDQVDASVFATKLIPAMEELRGTGRTTRMVEEAVNLASQGKSVLVVFEDHCHVKQFLVVDHNGRCRHNRNIQVVLAKSQRFDAKTLRIVDAGVNAMVLVDHHVIEKRLHGHLEMLHRFDRPPAPEAPDWRPSELLPEDYHS